MARITTLIIETLGGAPVFHIPFPISTLPLLAGVSSGLSQGNGLEQGENRTPHNKSGTELEHVNLVFRNHGGTPTFHVGGADVGVGPSDAWDYTRVINAVMKGRAARVAGDNGVDLRVKVEEESPRIPSRAKGKERQRDGDGAEHAGPRRQTSESRRRPLSTEERLALVRGSIALSALPAMRAEGMAEFAVLVDPTRPVGEPLSPEEDEEWWTLWDALLRMDRWFFGPLRDKEALQARTDVMLTAAAARVRARSTRTRPLPHQRREGFYVAPQDDLAHDAGTELVPATPTQHPPSEQRPRSGQSGRVHAAEPKPLQTPPLREPLPHEGDRGEPHTDRVVQELRQQDVVQGQNGNTTNKPSRSRSNRPALSVERGALANGGMVRLPEHAKPSEKTGVEKGAGKGKGNDQDKAWPPVRTRSRAKENGVAAATGMGTVTATATGKTRSEADAAVEAGTKRARERGDGDGEGEAKAKRARTEVEVPLQTTMTKTTTRSASGSAQASVPTRDTHLPPPRAPKLKHKTAYTNTRAYTALIPATLPLDMTNSKSAPTPALLTQEERTWLSAQKDLARAPGWWRPVRWIELGERMYEEWVRRERERKQGGDVDSPQEQQDFRRLYHGVLLEAWDRGGEWRFKGHERVFAGRERGVPWAAWIRGKEGAKWRAGGT
ncbi:hypothetical protein MSAN_00608800 [Mycena sanguinolenta]|uniref:Uncharacterized protein n=1 Tax=Mycena sanguinolenta TaxID=230812 RepID=A0A8H7DIX9_9AGAR|nr:hypothetical protein MSAN_00608800 [Mycena sanguinolenta]